MKSVKYIRIISGVFLLLVSLNLAISQEMEQSFQSPYPSGSFWRMEGSLLVGIGLEDHEVGMTTDNKKITISGGGGIGGIFSIGYCITPRFDLSLGFGIQNSSLEPEVKNAEGSFLRTSYFTTIKYIIPVSSAGYLKIGAGAGYYSAGDLDVDLSEVAGGAHNVYKYDGAPGFHITADYEGVFTEKFTWIIGLKYYNVTFDLKSAKSNDVSIPLSIIPADIISDIGELDGSGVDFIIALNLYL